MGLDPIGSTVISDTARSVAQSDLGSVPVTYGDLCVTAGVVIEEGIGTNWRPLAAAAAVRRGIAGLSGCRFFLMLLSSSDATEYYSVS